MQQAISSSQWRFPRSQTIPLRHLYISALLLLLCAISFTNLAPSLHSGLTIFAVCYFLRKLYRMVAVILLLSAPYAFDAEKTALTYATYTTWTHLNVMWYSQQKIQKKQSTKQEHYNNNNLMGKKIDPRRCHSWEPPPSCEHNIVLDIQTRSFEYTIVLQNGSDPRNINVTAETQTTVQYRNKTVAPKRGLFFTTLVIRNPSPLTYHLTRYQRTCLPSDAGVTI